MSLWSAPHPPPDVCEGKVGLFPINSDEEVVVYLRIN